jgi:hypothetical protein
MPIKFACPECNKPLKVPEEYAGRRLKCPACANPVVIPKPADPWDFDAPDTGAAYAGAGAGSGGTVEGDRDSWNAAAAGFSAVWWGTTLCVLAVSIVVGILVVFIAIGIGDAMEMLARLAARGEAEDGSEIYEPPPRRSGTGLPSEAGQLALGIAGIVVLLVVVGLVLRVVGFARVVAVPGESGAKPIAFLAFFCELGAFGAWTVWVAGHFVELAPGLVVLAFLGQLGAWLLCLLFLLVMVSSIGSALGSNLIGPKVTSFLLWFLLGIVFLVAFDVGFYLFLRSLLTGDPSASKGMMFLIALGVTVLVDVVIPLIMAVKYLGVLSITTDQIRRRAVWGRS